MDNKQDLEDVRRVLEGDRDAFEGIVHRWQGPLINLAFRFCRDRHRAEEMAQDAFVHIYRKLDKFHGDAAFSTWMFTLALNLYRSFIRRKVLPVEAVDDLPEIADGSWLQQRVEQNEREEWIRRAVLSLPPRYRDAIIIFYFREMDLTETAAILGVAEGTAKAWLHRGRELLRRKLERLVDVPAAIGEVGV